MKKIVLLLLPIILLGAGCLGNRGATSSADGGVFKTTTSGEEWSQAVLVPTARGTGTLATTNVLNMTMDPQDSKYLYIGTRSNGMLYSEDAAASWRQSSEPELNNGTVYSIAVDPENVCSVYIAKGKKLFSTHDCMRSFDNETYLETRVDVNVVKVAVDWFNPNVLWLGLSNGDVLRSDDKGKKWRTVLNDGNEISQILVSNADSRQVLISTFSSGIQKTTDSGETWEEIEFPEGLQNIDDIFTMTQSADSKTLIAASKYGLLQSKDFGSTWEELDLLSSPGEVVIRAIGMDPEGPATLFYAAGSTFYRSSDGGESWETERLQSSRVPRAMLVDPNDPTVLYVGVATAT